MYIANLAILLLLKATNKDAYQTALMRRLFFAFKKTVS